MYLWDVQISFCYKICISSKFPVRVAAIVLGLTLWQTLFYRVGIKWKLNNYFIGWKLRVLLQWQITWVWILYLPLFFFEVVSTPFHTKIETIRIIQMIELLRISNKKTYVKLVEQILAYDKHSKSAFILINREFAQNYTLKALIY